MKHFIIIITLIVASIANGQTFKTELSIGEGESTVSTCKNKAIAFMAKAYLNDVETSEAKFSIDFDDGTIVNNPTEGTFNHAFASDGIFMPMLKAEYNGLTAYSKVTVKIGKRPDFSGFKTNIDDHQ